MKVQQIQQTNLEQKKSPQFNGAVDASLRFLATNQGVGANLTDVCFMVVPRIASDAQRGPAACVETARREASGTTNHSLIGVYGIIGGMIAALVLGLKDKFNVDANKIFAAPETINILAENKAKQLQNKNSQLDYLKETLSQIRAYNPNADKIDKDGFVKLTDDTINDVAKILDDAISNKKWTEWKDKTSSNSIDVAINKITEQTGAQGRYKLELTDKKLVSNTDLKTLLEDVFKVSKSFNEEKVKEAFDSQIKNNLGIKDNAYIKKLSKFMKSRSIAGFVIATAIGMSIQPLNIYLTKLKTGSDGFVGVEGRSKDDSMGFKLLKGVSSVAFFSMVLATLQTGVKGFMDKMAFKGFWPTISQLKGIYGLTIISRLLAARDKDELRESLTKDTLGFLSWLVLGDFVNKITAESLDKSVMNRTAEVENKGWFKRIFNSSLKTRDEVLVKALADNGGATTKIDGEKVVAKTFKEMMKDLDKISNKEVVKATKKQLRTLNKAQLAGYAFSGLVLGIGIPNLNIYITNKLDKQRKEKAAKEAQVIKA